MQLNKRLFLIVNPISGQGAASRKAVRIVELARRAGYSPTRIDLHASGDGTRAARKLHDEEADIVAVGGDGTFNEILNGAHPRRHRLLFLPCGTVNVVAKEFHIPANPNRWFKAMDTGDERVLDSALCNERRFFIVAGGGLDAFATRLVAMERDGHLKFSDWWMPALRAVLHYRNYDIRVHAEGFDPTVRYNYVVVGNCATYGGPLVFASEAEPDDGLIDVCAMRIESMADLVSVTLSGLGRWTRHLPIADYRQVKKVRLEGSSDYYQFDGEYGGELPVEISVVPRSVRMLVPRGR